MNDKTFKEQIARNMIAERCRAGLTLEDVCNTLKIGITTLWQWEHAVHKVSLEDALKLANLYGCNIDAFILKCNIAKCDNENLH